MKKTPFIWLGANRARKWPVGEKVRWLDQAASAGLPVPNGAVLLDELFQLFWEAGVVEVRETAVFCPDPDWLYESLYDGVRFPHLDHPVALRAAYTTTDEPQTPVKAAVQAAVDLNDPEAMAESLTSVWSVSPDPGRPFRRDVLVMMMTAGAKQGTAVTGSDKTADHITTTERAFTIPQLAGFFPRTDHSLPPYAQRLQKLLRGVRRTFGQGAWQIDWLDDGEICWILKVAK